MASTLERLRSNNKKNGLFYDNAISISYPLGFPMIDQQLGAVYIRKSPNGEIVRDVHVGVPAGSFTIFTGPTSSGKTAAAIQAACNIVEPFGENGVVIHKDGENSTTYDRVQVLSGWDSDKIKVCYSLEKGESTWENVLEEVLAIAEDKEAAGDSMIYNTGQRDIWGNEYRYYYPTVIIIDSLLKFMSKNEATDMINGLSAGGRSAIYNGNFFRNALGYMYDYNINIFVIAHLDDAMPDMRGMQKPKQMTFMPTGKYMSGGHKTKLLTSSIIGFEPIKTKDEIKTEEVNGYNGVPTKMYVIKSRTSKGGFTTIQEFIQESGFDSTMTLYRLANDRGLILGRNPSRYFESMPDVKFDTRILMREMAEKPELTRAIYKECTPILRDMIPVIDTTNEDDLIYGAKRKKMVRDLMREMVTDQQD